MIVWGITAMGVAAFTALLVSTGRWRLLFAPFTIRTSGMTVDALDLHVSDPFDIERVDQILRSFGDGFNATLLASKEDNWRTFCKTLDSIYEPFAHEGAAMAYVPRHFMRLEPASFEKNLVKRQPEFRYLYYVGLGFWWGIRSKSPARVMRWTADLDPLHRFLCFDGYGFAQAFFHYRKNPGVLKRLDRFDGYAKNAAYQGVGRAFFFLYMSRPDLIAKHVDALGEHAADAAGGIGLAAAFVNPDALSRAFSRVTVLPQSLHDHIHLGLCFGLKARSINDLESFERHLVGLDESVQEAIWASIRECDRVELLVRDRLNREPMLDGYRVWRQTVTDWMAQNVEFPVRRLRGQDTPGVNVGTHEGHRHRAASSAGGDH